MSLRTEDSLTGHHWPRQTSFYHTRPPQKRSTNSPNARQGRARRLPANRLVEWSQVGYNKRVPPAQRFPTTPPAPTGPPSRRGSLLETLP